MPRLSNLILLPVALAAAACLAVVPGLGRDDMPGLKGTVSVSNFVIPSDAALEPGRIFDQERATTLLTGKGSVENNWYEVPAWCVGDWYSQRQQRPSSNQRTDERSNLSRGTFADKTGQVWEYDRQGYWAESDVGKNERRAWVLMRSPVEGTERNLSFHEELVVFTLDRQTRVIKDREHLWQDNVMYRSQGMLKYYSEVGTYDSQGMPMTTRRGLAITDHWKNAEFAPHLSDKAPDGQPLYPMFVKFLMEHGMADKIPDPPLLAPGPVAKP